MGIKLNTLVEITHENKYFTTITLTLKINFSCSIFFHLYHILPKYFYYIVTSLIYLVKIVNFYERISAILSYYVLLYIKIADIIDH